MKRENQGLYDKFGAGLSTAAIWTLRIVGSVIFLALGWYALRYTQYMPDFYSEVPINMHDSMWRNLLCLILAVLVLAVLFVLERRLSAKVRFWALRFTVMSLSLWVGLLGLFWITLADRVPVGDQAFINGGASYFIEGNYAFLGKGAYCDMWPQQLGLIAVVELLFRFLGTYNYFACQVINVGLAVGISILGYLLVRRMSDHVAVAAAYCILMFACLPMIFYTGWIYGDIPSIFFMLLAAYLLLRYTESKYWGWLAGVVMAVTMAVVVRENSLIMLVALCLSAGVYAIAQRDKRLALAIGLSVLLPWLAYAGIAKMYQLRSGTEPLGGIPAVTYVAMGMQEHGGKYGWFSQYSKEVYWAAEFDPKMAARVSWQDVKARLKEFAQAPSYAWHFYREKILSQWNQPMYQSMFFSAQYPSDKEPPPDSFDARMHGQYLPIMLNICDRLQFILYIGILCYFLFAVKKGSNILQHMLAATIIGGFFFSIIWEAKARYILPYYLMMYPLAVVGYWQLFNSVMSLIGRLRKKDQADNIIPFRRAA